MRCVLLALLTGSVAAAAELHNPVVAVPLMTQAPIIDGVIHEAEWGGATRQAGFVSLRRKRLSHREGVFWLGSDGKGIFVAVKTEMPPQGGLLARVRPRGNLDVQAYRDDSIELWFDPFRSLPRRKRLCYQIIVNSLGALYDVAHDRTKGMTSTSWRVQWRFASKVVGGWWHVELAIPLPSLGFEGKLAGTEWGVRIGRNWQQPWEQSCWSPRAIAYDDPETMALVRWQPAAPVAQMLRVADREAQRADLSLRLANPTQRPMTLKVTLSNQHVDSPANTKTQSVQLAAGRSATVRLGARTYAKGDNLSRIDVTSADGRTVYFRRDFGWSLERPASRWRVAVHQREAIDLAFAYYPYHNKIKARLDISSLRAGPVTGATLAVRRKADKETIARVRMPQFKEGRSEVMADLRTLEDGTYQVLAELTGGKGVPKRSPVKEFVRKAFLWEHNKLGITDRAMPPFTPLEVDGNKVRAVLREHVMNDQGLWDQVVSKGEPLLAAPMRWEVVVLHTRATGRGDPLAIERKSEVAVRAESRLNLFPAQALVRAEYDVDGMMKVTLDSGPPLSRDSPPYHVFDLVIPLREGVAKLMHVCGDGLRFNYGGEVPKGEGRVWDSSKASRLGIAGTFVPYIWLGDEERGLAWFADSDRDWILGGPWPVLDISRRRGVVELRVHFITHTVGGWFDRPRKIVFGLQATPTKPMMATPSWRRINSLVGRAPRFLRYHVLGATYYWGATSFDVFPLGKDFSIYDQFAAIRRTGKVDRAFFKRWLLKYGPDGKRARKWDAHIWSGAHSFKGQPDIMIPYTNARGIGPCEEFNVFQDEWLVSDYTSRSGAAVAYDVDPVRSFQDFALWHFAKMLDSGAFDGIYFDNTFLKANRDTVSGGAYVRDDGTVQPSCGLWNMREYLKRAAILCWQKGRPFANVSHMTNTQIVPINTWAGINLCWEWRYGDTDCHDRFAADYCRAVCIGLQSGSRPTALLGLHVTKKELRPWVARTCLAWTLVHEIYPAWSYGEPFQTVFQRLYDFGYGTGQCRVHRYWEPQPIRIEGIEAKALVIAKPGAVAVLVTNTGKDGTCRLSLEPALGIRDDAPARDGETGRAVQRIGARTYEFALRRHDFKLIFIGD